jgi:hypothetical protein
MEKGTKNANEENKGPKWKKLLGDQAIGGKRQQPWPINTRGIFQEKSGGHHLIKKT